jgi:MFS family permease
VTAADAIEFKTDLGAPSRVRWGVLAFGVAVAAVTYLDRVCISQTADDMRAELGLSKEQMSFVFSAFTLAYGLFEIPTGAWGDRIGTRRVMTRIVLWWSSFTVATSAVTGYFSLLTIRFLFGAGEAGAWPTMARTFSRWFPSSERGTAQGIFFMGAHLAGGLTPLLVSGLLVYLPWRAIFVLFGLVGFAWALAWWLWFRDEPHDHPAVNEAERKYIESGRMTMTPEKLDGALFRKLAGSLSLWALCLMYATQCYGFYFFITWLPTYIKDTMGDYSPLARGLLSGLPLTLSVLADLTGGLTSDWAVRHFGPRWGRCGVGGLSLLVAGLSMLGASVVPDPLASALLIGVAGAAGNFLLGASWSTSVGVAGPHAGLVSACMNTAGQVGGFLSPIIAARFANWSHALALTAALYLFGALCWTLVDPRRNLFEREMEP